jgi:hypothetical protein
MVGESKKMAVNRKRVDDLLASNRRVVGRIDRHYRFAVGGLTTGLRYALRRAGLGHIEEEINRRTGAERYRYVESVLPNLPEEPRRRAEILLLVVRGRATVGELLARVVPAELKDLDYALQVLSIKEEEIAFLGTLSTELTTLGKTDYAMEVDAVRAEVEEARDELLGMVEYYRSSAVFGYQTLLGGKKGHHRRYQEYRVWIQTERPLREILGVLFPEYAGSTPEDFLMDMIGELIDAIVVHEGTRGRIREWMRRNWEDYVSFEIDERIMPDEVKPPDGELNRVYGFAWFTHHRGVDAYWYLYERRPPWIQIRKGTDMAFVEEVARWFPAMRGRPEMLRRIVPFEPFRGRT